MNLTHRIRWFLREGGADAEGGGTDGIGGFEEARREHPRAGAVDGAVAQHGAALSAGRRGGGDAEAWRPSGPRSSIPTSPTSSSGWRRRRRIAIPATVLLREIQERGYDGGYTRVKQFVRGLAPAVAAEPVVRFETEPGQQMQADWATVGRGARQAEGVHRDARLEPAAYVEFCDDERVETLIGCHETRVPGVRRRAEGGALRQHENGRARAQHLWPRRAPLPSGLPRLAQHAGSLPRLCQPYRAQTKGKVERFIGYLKRSFWVPFVASHAAGGR